MKLTAESLEFARNHIQRFYTSDFFPSSEVLNALWADWDEIQKFLSSESIQELGHPPLIMQAPKARGGYRIVHDPNPFDSLAYTAIAHTLAPYIESRRENLGDRVFSYKLNVNSRGDFFDEAHNGFQHYTLRSLDLANSFDYVLVTDIAAFYNQIYLHRLQSAIELCHSNLTSISSAVEEFMLNLNERVSIGIPVGPAPSIILAETALLDVDQWIQQRGFEYVRYVDDFRIFANSKLDLETLLQDLVGYLYTNHRLTLASEKTFILPTETLVEQYLDSPESKERDIIHANIAQSIASQTSVAFRTSFTENPPSWTKLSPEERSKLLNSLLHSILQQNHLDLGLARHLLRRAKHARLRAIIVPLLDNIEFFIPVFRDVCLYLDHVMNDDAINRNLDRLEIIIRNQSIITRSSFCSMWLRWLVTRKQGYSKSQVVRDFIMGEAKPLRFQADHAKLFGHESWVKEHRSNWQQLGSSDRWSLLLAASVLGVRERTVWMNQVLRSADPIDRAIARYVLSYGGAT
ncbi:RNA-directed DNA polymerase [Nostoc sp.]